MSSSSRLPANAADLRRKLERLLLTHAARGLDPLLDQARQSQWSQLELLDELVETELQGRQQRGIERRLRRSRLGRFKPLIEFDWSWPRKIDRPAIERALSGHTVAEGRNLILLGANGVGKTMLAKNIAYACIQAGYSALFVTAAELLDTLGVDSAELRKKRLARFVEPHLLVVDELGYLAYDDRAADLLFLLVNARYIRRRSLLITTNLSFSEWHIVFPNAPCILTLIDRLTHHADPVLIEADSYRARESREAALRRQPQ
jgi:DNA replication protein DnaC